MFGASGVALRSVLRPHPSDGPIPTPAVATAAFAALSMNSRLFIASNRESQANLPHRFQLETTSRGGIYGSSQLAGGAYRMLCLTFANGNPERTRAVEMMVDPRSSTRHDSVLPDEGAWG